MIYKLEFEEVFMCAGGGIPNALPCHMKDKPSNVSFPNIRARRMDGSSLQITKNVVN